MNPSLFLAGRARISDEALPWLLAVGVAGTAYPSFSLGTRGVLVGVWHESFDLYLTNSRTMRARTPDSASLMPSFRSGRFPPGWRSLGVRSGRCLETKRARDRCASS
jgi:hypothetical protein